MRNGNDEIFKALADGHRRRIVAALCAEPMVAGDLGRLVGLAPNAVSFHLKWLRSAGLVDVRREGRYLRYSVNGSVLADWRVHVEGLFGKEATAKAAGAGSRGSSASASGRKRSAGRTRKATRPPAPPVIVESDDKLPTELL